MKIILSEQICPGFVMAAAESRPVARTINVYDVHTNPLKKFTVRALWPWTNYAVLLYNGRLCRFNVYFCGSEQPRSLDAPLRNPPLPNFNGDYTCLDRYPYSFSGDALDTLRELAAHFWGSAFTWTPGWSNLTKWRSFAAWKEDVERDVWACSHTMTATLAHLQNNWRKIYRYEEDFNQ